MSEHFTDTKLKALKPKAKRYDVTDKNRRGFMLRVEPTGRKTFYFRYHVNGKQHRVKLGNYPPMTLADAYEAYQVLANRVRRGSNVAVDIQRERMETVELLAEEWMVRFVRKERKYPQYVEQRLNADVLPVIGALPVTAVTRRDIVEVTDRIVDREAPIVANRTFSILKQMFSFAVERGYLDHSPMAEMRKRPGGDEVSRERFLSADEIRIFWTKLDTANMTAGMRIALKLLLVTGQRLGEVAEAEWSEFDLNKAIWTIPAERIKGKKKQVRGPHEVPLSALAIQLLGELQQGKWLFKSTHADKPVRRSSITHAATKNREHFGIEPFTVHDLRRTAATRMAELGIDEFHIAKVQNHSIRGVTQVYNRYSYLNEKRAALSKWAVRLVEILNG